MDTRPLKHIRENLCLFDRIVDSVMRMLSS